MCGLAGWFSTRPVAGEETARLQAMGRAILHRGPDGEGQQISSHAAFCHRRLAIIDLDGGQQPMADTDTGTLITFNGEIYNYQSLRQDLKARGVHFSSHSDTEVILKLYQVEGLPGFNKLRGMFAFALWDAGIQKGYLVRDSLGIKPLFYRQMSGKLLFGSEAKAILAHAPEKPRMNTDALHLLMNFRYIPGDQSLFEGILQLSPGEILEWSCDNELRSLRLHPQTRVGSHSIPDLLDASVNRHLVADVDVGCYLSGGVDSATIALLASRHLTTPLKTFTLDVGDDPMESRYAAETAKLLGIDNLQASANINLADDLPAVIWHLELPKVNSVQLYLLARHASAHIKVVLSGLGGDELFLGYNLHRLLAQTQRVRDVVPPGLARWVGTIGQRLIQLSGASLWSEPERAMQILQRLGRVEQIYGTIRNIWDAPQLRENIYGPRLLDANPVDAWQSIENQWSPDKQPLDAAREFEWNNKLVNDLLWQEDRCSMAFGLESRVPFVDVDLKAALAMFSPEQLMPGGHPKGLMKAELAKILPRQVLQRKKSGFQVDSPSFFKHQLADLARRYLSPEYVESVGLFNPRFVAQIVNMPAKKAYRWHFFMLYLMLGCHLWVEMFENGKLPEQC